MRSMDLIKFCLDSIRQISDEILDAIIYIDAGCSEAFLSIGAFPVLLELGARNVCSLENATPLDAFQLCRLHATKHESDRVALSLHHDIVVSELITNKRCDKNESTYIYGDCKLDLDEDIKTVEESLTIFFFNYMSYIFSLEVIDMLLYSIVEMKDYCQVVGWNLASADSAKKIMFITTCLLSDAHKYILRCLNVHRCTGSCTIFTSISEVAHSAYVDSPLGPDAFREYESLLLQDYEELLKKSNLHEEYILNSEATSTERDVYGSRSDTSMEVDRSSKLVVSVHHFPMVFCALSPRVFVFPCEGALGEARLSNDHEDALSPGLPAISTGLFSNADDIPPGATLTAHFLYELVSRMDLKMEIFSLGDLSKSVGKILTDMSSLYDVGRRNKRSLGLLLVDRSLDLLTPCCHGDSLVDRMLSSLHHMKGTISSSQVRTSQHTKTNLGKILKHSSLDARIPLGTILNKEGSDAGRTQLSKAITAFESGWNFRASGSEIVSLTDKGDIFSISSSKGHDLDQLSGYLISNENYLGANFLEALLDRRMKDSALLIKKWLIETIRREKIPFTMKGRLNAVSASEFHSLITLLASNDMSLLRNKGIIQLAVAAETALNETNSSRWDAFTSAERILSMSTGDTSQTLSSQIRDLINTSAFVKSADHQSTDSSHGLLSFQDALLLAATGYILAGESFPTSGGGSPFSWEEEHSLKEVIVDVILEMPIPPNFRFLHGLEEELRASSCKRDIRKHQEKIAELYPANDFDDQWGSWDDETIENEEEHVYGNMQLKLELRDRIDILFKYFHKLSGLKWRNPAVRDLHSILESNFGTDNYNKRGFLSKLLTMVLAKYDIPGLEYHSSAVGRFLKSGFSRFGLGQSNPRLGDQDVLLVFVVGGINGLEVFEAQKEILDSGRQDVELLIGGTTILTPDDMFELLLGSSSYIKYKQ